MSSFRIKVQNHGNKVSHLWIEGITKDNLAMATLSLID